MYPTKSHRVCWATSSRYYSPRTPLLRNTKLQVSRFRPAKPASASLGVQNRHFRAKECLPCTKRTVLYAIRGPQRHIGRLSGKAALMRRVFPQFRALRTATRQREALAALAKKPEMRTKPSISCKHGHLLHGNDGFVRRPGPTSPPEPDPQQARRPAAALTPSPRKSLMPSSFFDRHGLKMVGTAGNSNHF